MPNDDEPKRKAHTKEVLRELFAKSGNMCAWQGCPRVMIKADGKFVGQICHIEGVKGERFRADMSNDDRAAVANLMLLCYEHHIETNDESVWTVDRLKRMKSDHEALFTDPEIQIYQAYIDRSARRPLNKAKSGKRFCDVLGWSIEPIHLRETIADINDLFERVEKLDLQSRLFVVAVVERAWRVRNTANVNNRSGHLLLRWDDFADVTGECEESIVKRLGALEAHGLGSHDQMEIGDHDVYAIKLYRTRHGQWDFWSALAEFAEKSGEKLEPIIIDLDLSRLD